MSLMFPCTWHLDFVVSTHATDKSCCLSVKDDRLYKLADSGISHYGCNEDGTIQWIKETFPDVVTELLTQEKDDDEEKDEEG